MILDEIVAATKERVVKLRNQVSYEQYKEEACRMAAMEGYKEQVVYPFEEQLSRPGMNFICEVKRASPSKGLIAKEFPYTEIAREYEAAGAACISVLTEPEFFMGSSEYLREIRKEVKIPLLRKDFIIDKIQIYEAKILGADCVLLICAVLDDTLLKQFIGVCSELHLSALVEAHDEAEVYRALKAGARIIGVNNRNLKDFTVDFRNSIRLRKLVGNDVLFVAESGVKKAEDIKLLYDAKVNGVLIGETLMRCEDKKEEIRKLTTKICV